MLLTNLCLVTVSGETIENGWILFDEKIRAMGDMANFPHSGATGDIFTQSRDFSAAPVSCYPGFVDAHTHLGLFGDAQDWNHADGNEKTNPSTAQIRALDGIDPFDLCWAQALAAGVTTVCVTPGSANPIAGFGCVLKTYAMGLPSWRILNGENAMKLALGDNPKRIYGKRDLLPSTRMGTAAFLRQKLALARNYEGDDMELNALSRLFTEKLPAHIHAHRADDILTALRLANEFSLEFAIVHCTGGHVVAQELSGKNVLCGPLLLARCKPELAQETPKNPALLHRAGANVAIVTDHPETPAQYLPVTAGLAVREGLPYDIAIRGITLTPAEILGIDKRVGSLEVGKDADMVLFSADPLTIAAGPVSVVTAGKMQV
ncbi:MAG: amidohydrolase family protein [Oscillospiraceae bacterium]|nr:amidohydrolase family protein [Oscillospiraceae bacterium]